MQDDEIRNLLRTDDTNSSYFIHLYKKRMRSGQEHTPLRIHQPGADSGQGPRVYPISIAPPELLNEVSIVQYTGLDDRREQYRTRASTAAVWYKKMQAGSGSSLQRTRYLSMRRGLPESRIRIGSKGTDLMLEVPDSTGEGLSSYVSLAEAQLIQAILAHRRGEVGEVIVHDIVSSETAEAVAALWSQPCLAAPGKTYAEYFASTWGVSRSGVTEQAFVPTLDESGALTTLRRAPAGHALFAVEALRAAYLDGLRPSTARPLIGVISNGEDLNSAPDPLMIGHILEEHVPIALVTTERTPVDRKGGLLSLLVDSDGKVSLTVLETAQAAAAGQEKLFSELPGVISTNLTLFNYQELVPLIRAEIAEIGEERFLELISPDVISNVKEQRDPDGQLRKYTQLEGAMGSTIMNLDRYWRKKHGHPLVRLINVSREKRTDFFAPIKSAFDFFMQFHSDRFDLDSETFRLRNLRPGALPVVALRDPGTRDSFYQDVQNVLETFQGARIRELDELSITGKIRAQGVAFRGKVRVEVHGDGTEDLSAVARGDSDSGILENVELVLKSRSEPKSA